MGTHLRFVPHAKFAKSVKKTPKDTADESRVMDVGGGVRRKVTPPEAGFGGGGRVRKMQIGKGFYSISRGGVAWERGRGGGLDATSAFLPRGSSGKGKVQKAEVRPEKEVEGRFCLSAGGEGGRVAEDLGAGVAELADAPDSKSGAFTGVWVRPPSPVPFLSSGVAGARRGARVAYRTRLESVTTPKG